MLMKKIVFLAHDPGGYDALLSVVERLEKEQVPLEFYCVGPAEKLSSVNSASESEVMQTIVTMLEENEIAGLVTGTSWGNTQELKAMAACKKAGIPTISILDYWSNYKVRFKDVSGNYTFPDYYVVMDELAAIEAIREGVPADIIKVLGHPGLDKYLSLPKIRTCSGKNKKVLFLSQPLSALYGKELGFTEHQALEDSILAVQGYYDCSMRVKFHPKDDIFWKESYADISVDGALRDIMPEYNLIIGMNTIGLLHAVLMGIPAISYQPNLQRPDLCITNKLGLTRLISSYQELDLALNAWLREDVKDLSLPENILWLDGHSTERVTKFVRRVLLNEF